MQSIGAKCLDMMITFLDDWLFQRNTAFPASLKSSSLFSAFTGILMEFPSKCLMYMYKYSSLIEIPITADFFIMKYWPSHVMMQTPSAEQIFGTDGSTEDIVGLCLRGALFQFLVKVPFSTVVFKKWRKLRDDNMSPCLCVKVYIRAFTQKWRVYRIPSSSTSIQRHAPAEWLFPLSPMIFCTMLSMSLI